MTVSNLDVTYVFDEAAKIHKIYWFWKTKFGMKWKLSLNRYKTAFIFVSRDGWDWSLSESENRAVIPNKCVAYPQIWCQQSN